MSPDMPCNPASIWGCLGYKHQKSRAVLPGALTVTLVVSACARPFSVSSAKSVLPCILPSAFQVLCPCRTRTMRLDSVSFGRGSGVASLRSSRCEKSSLPFQVKSCSVVSSAVAAAMAVGEAGHRDLGGPSRSRPMFRWRKGKGRLTRAPERSADRCTLAVSCEQVSMTAADKGTQFKNGNINGRVKPSPSPTGPRNTYTGC